MKKTLKNPTYFEMIQKSFSRKILFTIFCSRLKVENKHNFKRKISQLPPFQPHFQTTYTYTLKSRHRLYCVREDDVHIYLLNLYFSINTLYTPNLLLSLICKWKKNGNVINRVLIKLQSIFNKNIVEVSLVVCVSFQMSENWP